MVFSFAIGFLAATAYAYFQMTGRNLIASAGLGIVIGLVLAFGSVRHMRNPPEQPTSVKEAATEATKRIGSRLALSLLLLGIALAAGYAAHSVKLFTVLLVAGIAFRMFLTARHRGR